MMSVFFVFFGGPFTLPDPSQCLFELHTAITMGRSCNVDIILTKDQLAQFKNFVKSNGYGGVDEVLFNKISSRRATATVPADLEAIRKLIEQSVGYDRLDESVIKKLRDWQVKEAGAIASASRMRMQMGAVITVVGASSRSVGTTRRRRRGTIMSRKGTKAASFSVSSDDTPGSPTILPRLTLPESEDTIAHMPAQAATLPRTGSLRSPSGVVVNRRASLELHEARRVHDLDQPPTYPFASFRKPLALEPLPVLSGPSPSRYGKQNRVAPIPADAPLSPDYEFRLRQAQDVMSALSTAAAVHVAPLAEAGPSALPKSAWRALPTGAPPQPRSSNGSYHGGTAMLLRATSQVEHISELRDCAHGLLAGSGFSPERRALAEATTDTAEPLIRPGSSGPRGRRESSGAINRLRPHLNAHRRPSSDDIVAMRRQASRPAGDSSDDSRDGFDAGDGHAPNGSLRNNSLHSAGERVSVDWGSANPGNRVVRIDSLA